MTEREEEQEMKKKAALGLAGLAAVAAIGGTWAYWNQNLSVDNEFQAGNFDSDIVEEFKPETDWLPGETIPKVVSVKNSGNVDMAVMAKITQKWEGENLVFEGPEGTDVYAAEVQWGNVAAYRSREAGETAVNLKIETFVDSIAEVENTWVLADVKEQEDGSQDLYFVYSEIVGTGETGVTTPLLTSVTMNPTIESGVTSKTYEVAEDGTVTEKTLTGSPYSYEGVQYTMTINAKTVQATADAVKDVFGAAFDMPENDEEFVISDFLSANSIDKPTALDAE